jgi:Ti-type conjugative transfer relaxase TraA
MAIGYARIEFVKRSNGKTACAKAAYNSKSRIEFQGNSSLAPATYDWASKTHPSYHEILLPEGAHEKFKSPQLLWNAVEAKEKKCNSVVASELVLALPDDQMITIEDRIHLAKTFVQTHFIDKGLAAQIDIHPPERKIQITQNDKEKGLFKGMNGNIIEEKPNLWKVQFDSTRIISFNPNEFTGFIEKENNWHAHVLITTRRFQKDGLDLGEKARDLMPRICKGKVISGPDWGKLWTDHQNQFFQSKGLNLRVDPFGIQPQDHLGPVRMRGRAFALLEEHGRLIEQNALLSKDPLEILAKLTERQSLFTKEDLESFLQKHVPFDSHLSLKETFWKQKEIIPLIDKGTGKLTGKFSSEKVINEEKQILRLADRIYSKDTLKISLHTASTFSKSLNPEQKAAFDSIIRAKKLICLQGYAGTGKSHLLASLKDCYSHSGYGVRAFGPDSATADVLKEKGFTNSENIYRFLFGIHHNRRKIAKGKEVWILDEAGKLGNRPLLEFLKEAEKQQVKVLLAGDNSQFASVERGGMFQILCERYEPLILKDIQRQKEETQREIAKNLASGEVNAAIDKLSASTLRWSSSKKEAIEELVSRWALDSRSSSSRTSLIIAHSNDEVRLLNEMVRIVKKQRGELSHKEYACETTFGKIYLSVGDHIEFRKNDRELGVTNGLSGTLIEASPDKFIVSVEGKDTRIITFSPKEYHSYQLGYASTYFRSQGRTVNKAYVLHSSALNKRMFYVGLTRHVDEAYYFVSKDQAYCLADLKRQALRSSTKENTLSFTTQQAIESERAAAHKQAAIQLLKKSESFIDKLKGYGLAAYDLVKTKAETINERYHDRSPGKEFYHLKQTDTSVQADIRELPPEIPTTILSQETSQSQLPENTPMLSNVGQHQNKTPEQLFEARKHAKTEFWNSLTSQKQGLLQNYFSAATQASVLHGVVEIEASSTSFESAAHFKEWQEACGKRNSSALNLIQKMTPEELSTFLGKKTAVFIQTQATRYQTLIEQNEKAGHAKLEFVLRENIEPLLYRLFPDGPSRKEKGSFRFGAKGSLSVIHSGDKAGQYYDFEKQEGGGILKLVQHQLGLGRLEALEWTKHFLGIVHDIKIPKAFLKGSGTLSKGTDWISVTPDPKHPAPPLQSLGNQKLHHYFNETARHPYRDENGELLYYRLRLIDKNDSTKKITPPLSFGYWKSNPSHLCWELKGYDSGKACLYNIPALKENPLATILIVEGEKTADRALNKFPHESFISITWPGGAGAARRADWAPLVGRNVIIWPDNDKPGFQAAEDICQELRKVGIQSLKLIDPALLQKHFPEKWDLADPLPSGLPQEMLQTLLLSSLQKGIDPIQVLHRVSSLYRINDPNDRARVNEILWRVDARMRPELEQQKGSQFWKINEMILLETSRILLRQSQVQNTLKTKLSLNDEPLRRLTWQSLIYEAAHGKEPAHWEMDKMQNAIQKLPVIKHQDKLPLDKVLTTAFEKALAGHEMTITAMQQEIGSTTKFLEKQSERIQSIENNLSQHKDLGKGPLLDIKI